MQLIQKLLIPNKDETRLEEGGVKKFGIYSIRPVF